MDAVGALPVEGGQPLSVGVGIATGAAFVGNIQAVDRMVWSAIANATNLAARLQSLTRELDAAGVIDSTTWERPQQAAAGSERGPTCGSGAAERLRTCTRCRSGLGPHRGRGAVLGAAPCRCVPLLAEPQTQLAVLLAPPV